MKVVSQEGGRTAILIKWSVALHLAVVVKSNTFLTTNEKSVMIFIFLIT